MLTSRQIKHEFLIEEQQCLERQTRIGKHLLEQAAGSQIWLGENDLQRLLVLFGWRENHHVPISWMLERLLPIWRRRFSRYRSRVAIGCKVPTLVGRKSEEILRELIDRQYPTRENRIEARDRYRKRIEKRLAVLAGQTRKESTSFKYTSVLDAPSADDFVFNYGRDLRRWKRSGLLTGDALRELLRVKRLPWRGNPYRE